MFGGMSMGTQPSVSPVVSPLPLNTLNNSESKKNTMWDGDKKLFDISASSLMDSSRKTTNAQQPQPSSLLTTNDDMNTLWNAPQSSQQQP